MKKQRPDDYRVQSVKAQGRGGVEGVVYEVVEIYLVDGVRKEHPLSDAAYATVQEAKDAIEKMRA